ncbi:phosphocarrier protein HPr, partial [Mycoplasmopsis pullorum]
VKHGATVTIKVSGDDEEDAMVAIENALKSNNLI